MTVATKTRWPTMSDYQEAVQAPSICFPDPELKNGSPVMNKLGLPRPICGQFASVYEIETGGSRYAVKCFLRNIPDQHDRYARISAHLNGHGTSYFVKFDYQNDGIRVQGELRPLVKMEWIEGLALNAFIERNLSNRATLVDLEKRWLALLDDLRAARIAHGDLQHGNVLVVEDESLRLIDYDGMWVPALEGQTSNETGHPDFQSPLRTDRYFHAGIDVFSGAVIQVAIRALSSEPGLWSRYNNGDNLLFRRQDYLDPSGSALFAELKALGDDVIDEKLKVIVEACAALPRPEEHTAKAEKSSGKCESSKPRKNRKLWKKKPKKAREPEKSTKGGEPAARTTECDPATPESPRVALPGKNQRSAAPEVPPAVEKKPSSWITDYVAGAAVPKESSPSHGETPRKPETEQKARPTSEAPPASPATRGPGFLDLFLHVFVLVPMAVPAIAQWFDFLGIDADAMTWGQENTMNTTLALGILSLATLIVFRKHHYWTSSLFFGVMVLVSVYDLSTKLWTIGSPISLEENLYYYGFGQLLLITSGLGWVLHPEPK